MKQIFFYILVFFLISPEYGFSLERQVDFQEMIKCEAEYKQLKGQFGEDSISSFYPGAVMRLSIQRTFDKESDSTQIPVSQLTPNMLSARSVVANRVRSDIESIREMVLTGDQTEEMRKEGTLQAQRVLARYTSNTISTSDVSNLLDDADNTKKPFYLGVQVIRKGNTLEVWRVASDNRNSGYIRIHDKPEYVINNFEKHLSPPFLEKIQQGQIRYHGNSASDYQSYLRENPSNPTDPDYIKGTSVLPSSNGIIMVQNEPSNHIRVYDAMSFLFPAAGHSQCPQERQIRNQNSPRINTKGSSGIE